MLEPVKMSKDELIEVLKEILGRVVADDSFGGFLEYDYMHEDLEGQEIYVKASYRIGNSMGQGGLRMIGTIVKEDEFERKE